MTEKTLLIIEDDTLLSEALRECFCYEGYAVDIATDAQKARDLFTTKNYAVILLDLKLPGNGLNFLQITFKDNPKSRVFIITGTDIDSLCEEKKNLLKLAEHVFIKPFKMEKLIERVIA